MPSEKNLVRSMKLNIYHQILKKKEDTNDPFNYQRNITCIDKTIVDVSFQKDDKLNYKNSAKNL